MRSLQIALVLLAGMLLGALFFGGLWWTVQKGAGVKATRTVVRREPAAAHRASCWPDFILFAGADWKRLLAVPARIHHRARGRDQADRECRMPDRGGEPCTLVPTN